MRLSKNIQEEQRIQTDLIGPVPCFFAREAGWYRWQIVIRGPDPVSLLRGKSLTGAASNLSKGWRVEVDPISLL